MFYWAGLSPVNLFFIISPALSLICAFHSLALGILIILIALILFFVRPHLWATVTLLVVNLTVAVGAPYIWDNKLHDYQQRRILTFLNPGMDKLGAGYQVIQSRVAIGSGGLSGKGFLQGTQTKLAFLPEQHTDFIFSVVGEEFGFIGAISLLAVFFFVIWRAIKIATLTKSRFSSLVSVGLASILVFHVFVNIGMTIGVMPVTGLPLPFLSYGGSPLVTNMTLVGFSSEHLRPPPRVLLKKPDCDAVRPLRKTLFFPSSPSGRLHSPGFSTLSVFSRNPGLPPGQLHDLQKSSAQKARQTSDAAG